MRKANIMLLALCTAALAAGCGNSATDSKTSPAPEAPAQGGEVQEETSSMIDLNNPEDVADAGLTASEAEEMAYYLSQEQENSWAEYVDGDYVMDEGEMRLDADSAPTTPDAPVPGKYQDFVTLAEYKGMEIELPADAEIANGVTASIDFTGKLDGEEFEYGSASDYYLAVGTGALYFEDQLIGHKKGDSFTITVDYPDDYYDDALAGQEAEFDITVNALYTNTPDLALYQVVDGSTVVQYPEEQLKEWRESMLDELKSWSLDTVSDAEALIDQNFGSEEAFDSNLRYSAKSELVYLAIMDAEGLSKESDEFQAAVDKVLDTYHIESVDEALKFGLSRNALYLAAEQDLCEDILTKYQKQ